nr:oxidoreductase [Candidatus Pantoea persica]
MVGARGMLVSEPQAARSATLYQENGITGPGLFPDWFSRVRDTYYAHLDAFLRQPGGEKVAELPGLADGLRRRRYRPP